MVVMGDSIDKVSKSSETYKSIDKFMASDWYRIETKNAGIAHPLAIRYQHDLFSKLRLKHLKIKDMA